MDIYYRIDYALKIIINFEGTLFLKRSYDLKNTLNFEENKLITEGTILLIPFFFSKGHYTDTLNSEGSKKKVKKWLRSALSRKRKKRERVIDNLIELFGVFLN